MRPDKQKVVDEVWDEERIAGFLAKQPMGPGEDVDFSILLNAYRSMRPDDFARFVPMYLAAGKSLDARGRDGRNLRESIQTHRHAAPFVEILDNAG